MNTISHLTFRIRCWLDDRLPEPRQRVRALGAACAIGICTIWIGVFAVRAAAAGGGGGREGGTSAARATPEIRHAKELEAKLRSDAAFAGVSILPHMDYPGKLLVSGHAGDARALKARLAELDAKAEFVVQIR